MSTTSTYPVHVSAVLDRPSRALWLVKWLLVIPHYVVLAFLWLGFAVLSVVAFFAILFTGRYPRGIFAYNVGVMRWSWRVTYYAYGALGTDRYPPFTLEDVPDYPAHLSVDYPEHLSRGLVLVKWWLLAIPHYLIVGVFVGGGAWLSLCSDRNWEWSFGSGGLVSLLVCVSAVILLFSGTYPASLFDVVLGMQRWALRVAGYAALMTDVYPPFRLDLGGDDPDVLALEPPAAPGAPQAGTPATAAVGVAPASGTGGHWGAGRVIALVVGLFVVLLSAAPLIGGVALTAADHVGRDSKGYLTTPTTTLTAPGYAVASDRIRFESGGPDWAVPSRFLGTARVRVTPTDPAKPVFVGVGPAADVTRYLASVAYSTPEDVGRGDRVTYTEHSGSAPATPPTAQTFWTAKATGAGTQTLTWEPTAGDWTVVLMNADGSAGVGASLDAAATAPGITWIGVGLIAAGIIGLAIGAAIVIAVVASGGSGAGPVAPRSETEPAALG